MRFKEALAKIMKDANINQRQLATMTGCSRAAISGYLSGEHLPPAKRQKEILKALGLSMEFLVDEKGKPVGAMDKITPEEAARILGIGRQVVRLGLRQGVFPWGYAVKMDSGRWRYVINGKKLMEVEEVM